MKSLRLVTAIALAALVLPACSGDESAPDSGAAFKVTKVEWVHRKPCAQGTANQVTVTTTTTGQSGAVTYTFSGSGGCTAPAGSPSTFNCPEVAPYSYVVTAKDSQNHTATLAFTIGICSDSSVSN
jgi:hypothetical protein